MRFQQGGQPFPGDPFHTSRPILPPCRVLRRAELFQVGGHGQRSFSEIEKAEHRLAVLPADSRPDSRNFPLEEIDRTYRFKCVLLLQQQPGESGPLRVKGGEAVRKQQQASGQPQGRNPQQDFRLRQAVVVLPDVNDGDVLTKTLSWLSDIGVKGVILMRFANRPEQGLILENAPILPGQRVHTVEEFADLVQAGAAAFPYLRISGTPLYDPLFDSPFAIRKMPELLDHLPKINKKATIITGSVAATYIKEIIRSRGGDPDSVIAVNKEIACLITIEDLTSLNLQDLSDTVIIPGRAFVHDAEAEKVLSRDGVYRTVIRGPEMLSADGETSMGMTEVDVLTMEMEGFSTLIRLINQYGSTT